MASACREAAAQAAGFYGWYRIPCVDDEGRLRTVEDIHREIMSLI